MRVRRFVRPGLVPASLLPPDDPTRPSPRTARDWLVDVVMVAIAAVVGLLAFASMVSSSVHHVSDGQSLIDVLLGGLACVLLWWRRRFPVAIAIVGVGFGLVSSFAAVPALLALFTVAVHRRTSITVVVGIGGILSGLAYEVWWPQQNPFWVDVVVAVAVT